jgi:hypothetical protein
MGQLLSCCSRGVAHEVSSIENVEEAEGEALPSASRFSSRGAAHGWLQEIGLPQYAKAFEDAGFSDWELLGALTHADLEAITQHTGVQFPPGCVGPR